MSYKIVFLYLTLYSGVMLISFATSCTLSSEQVLSVPEDTPTGIPVMNLTKDGTLGLVSVTPNDKFTFDSATVSLQLVRKLTRNDGLVTVKVSYTCSGSIPGPTLTIYVTVENSDYNPPQWTPAQEFYLASISEIANPTTSVNWNTQPTLDDPDGAVPQDHIISIVPGTNSHYFTIVSSTSPKPSFSLTTALDYDVVTQINITLNANDIEKSTGKSKFNTTCLIVINVISVDNKPPYFEYSNYTATILSNWTKGMEVPFSPASVKAFDGDKSINAAIQYSIPFPDDDFTINSTTGIITTAVNFPTVGLNKIVIQATQVDNKDKTAQLEVQINVVSMASAAPKLNPSVYNISAPENTNINFKLIQIKAVNGDATGVTYAVTSFTDIFRITATNWVTLSKTLDYETVTSYSVNVSVTSGIYTDRGNVLVTVLPFNDNSPIFSNTTYIFEPTSRSVGTVIGTLQATDADKPPQSISYSLSPISPNFAVDSETGTISISSSPDKNVYIFSIIATDSGEPPLTGSIQIEITYGDTTAEVKAAAFGTIPIIILAVVLGAALIIFIALIIWYKKRSAARARKKRALANLTSGSQFSITDHWATSTQANPVQGFPLGGEYENGSYVGDLYSGDRDVGEIQLDETYITGGRGPVHGQNGSIRTMSAGSSLSGSRQTLMQSNIKPIKLGTSPNGVEVMRVNTAFENGSVVGNERNKDLTIYY